MKILDKTLIRQETKKNNGKNISLIITLLL